MKGTTIRSRFAILGAVAALALTLSACGSSTEPAATTEPSAGGGAPEVTELTVGIVPVVDHAGIFQAVNEGYFEEEGLTVTVQPAASGGALGPALLAGDLQASFATWPSWFLANENAAPLRFVGLGVSGTEGTAGIYSAPDSDITEPADLEGKTIAVNSLKNTGELTIRAVLDAEGVDTTTVTFTELPFPDMIGAVTQGNVDAIWLVEPFATGGDDAGLVKVAPSYTGPTADIPVSGVAMLASFVEQNPNTAAAFARALAKGNADIAADPELAREILLAAPFNQKPEVVEAMNLPAWVEGYPTAEGLEIWNELMVEYDLLPAAVDLSGVVFQP
ncbi:MAG: ABC transporter substrate-binding protein [Candidatus Microbacterium stercoravium]|uniref:ABC transporter substrate-binding protein n=1 Tax=Microbacterium sp. TaxID=51671 RepID=UPI003F9A52F7